MAWVSASTAQGLVWSKSSVNQAICKAFPSIHSSPHLAGLTSPQSPRGPSTTIYVHSSSSLSLVLCQLCLRLTSVKAGLVRGHVTDSCVTVSSSM